MRMTHGTLDTNQLDMVKTVGKVFSDSLTHQWPSVVIPLSFFFVICSVIFQAGRMSSEIGTLQTQQATNTQTITSINQEWARQNLTVNEQLAQIQQTLADMRAQSTRAPADPRTK